MSFSYLSMANATRLIIKRMLVRKNNHSVVLESTNASQMSYGIEQSNASAWKYNIDDKTATFL